MGCFYGTCMLTQAPLSSGTPVRLILLTQRSSAACSALGYQDETSLWTPVCLPVQGCYDDYGGVEAVAHDAAADILLAYLEQRHGRRFDLETLTSTLIEAPDQCVSSPAPRGSPSAYVPLGTSAGSGRTVVVEARPADVLVDRYGFALIPETIYQATLAAGGAVDNLKVRWRSVMERYRHARTMQRRQRAARELDPSSGTIALVRHGTEDVRGSAGGPPDDAPTGTRARVGDASRELPDDVMEAYMEAVMLYHEAPSGEYVLERYCEAAATANVHDAICAWGVFWLTLRRLHTLFQPQFVSGSQQPPYQLHRALAQALQAYLIDAERTEEGDDDLVHDGEPHPSAN